MPWKRFIDRLGTMHDFELTGELPGGAGRLDPAHRQQVLADRLKNAAEAGRSVAWGTPHRTRMTPFFALVAGIAPALACFSPAAPDRDDSREIIVYAAASLRDALQDLAPACERAVGVRLSFNFGASSNLARQIQAAGRADLFFSADEDWMDKVAAEGLVDAASRRTLLSNRLVVVGSPDVAYPIGSAADMARAPARFISLADPAGVPAGKYARTWLERQGQWEAVRARVAPALDVRAALAAVEAGHAEAGIVYRTDAALARRVRVALTVPRKEGPKITYVAAPLTVSKHPTMAAAFVRHLRSTEAARVFERHGFLVLAAP